jgi:hypothetical protein
MKKTVFQKMKKNNNRVKVKLLVSKKKNTKEAFQNRQKKLIVISKKRNITNI